MRSTSIKIPADVARTIPGLMWSPDKVSDDDKTSLAKFRTELNAKLESFGPCFVRLGTRSPKDSWFWRGSSDYFPITSGKDALSCIMNSERCFDDLNTDSSAKKDSFIWLREFWSMPEHQEFRCFMLNKELRGISQYYNCGPPFETKHYPWIQQFKSEIAESIRQFFESKFLPVIHTDNVVFDVFVEINKDSARPVEVKLIEINPADSFTYPALFTWGTKPRPFGMVSGEFSTQDFDGSLRYVPAEL